MAPDRKPAARRRWTSEEDAVVKAAAIRTRTTWAAVAKQLGRTEGAVVSRACVLRRRGVTVLQKKRRTKVKSWTRPEEKRLLAMYGEGKTLRQIGKALGRTKKAVDCRLYALRDAKTDRPSKVTLKERKRMEKLARQGLTIQQIAAATGRSESAVKRHLRGCSIAVKLELRPYTEADDAVIRQRVLEEASVAAIARELGRAHSSVRRRIDRLGLMARRGVWREPWKVGHLRQAAQLRADGWSDDRIGAKLGRSGEAVRIALRKHADRIKSG